MSKHTSGQWRLETVGKSAARIVSGKRIVAVIPADSTLKFADGKVHPVLSSVAQTDAKLLAASADLLESCKAFVECVVSMLDKDLSSVPERMVDAAKLAQDAIEKAGGK